MKKSKKIISIILALTLILSIGTIMLISNAEDNSRDTAITVSTDKSKLSAGETATVTVKATTNYAAGTISIPVFYDKTRVDVSDGTAPLSEYAVASVTTDLTTADSTKMYANTGLDSEQYGFVLVNYIASAGATVQTMLEEDILLTFTITAKADVNGEAIIKVITESAKTDSNIQGMLYFGAQPDGTEINTIPENVEGIDVTSASTVINISDGANTIALKDSAPYEAVIDTVNCGDYLGTIYGIDTLGWDDTLEADGALADFLTTAYGDDYLEIVVGDAGVETTGTVINVLDEDGAVVESYVFVYFGDIDMDGLVGLSDAAIAEYYEGYYEGIDTFEQFMAADVDGDGWPGLSDAVYMEYYEGYYEGMPEQADIAVVIVDNGLVYEMI